VKPLVGAIALLGTLAAALGVVYLVVPARSLPSFLPGHLSGVSGHHVGDAASAGAVAVMLWAFAVVVALSARR